MPEYIIVLKVEAPDGDAAWELSDEIEDEFHRNMASSLGVYLATDEFRIEGEDVPA